MPFHQLIQSLTNSSDQWQIVLFIISFIFCWNIENLFAITTNYKKWKHVFLNSKFVLSNFPFQVLLGLAFAKAIQWTSAHHFGLLYHLPGIKNDFLLFLIAFIALDFGEYIYHVIMHKAKRLWMFHAVHHTDLVVDTTTVLREHPGENLVRNTFTLIWVLLSGTFFWMLIARQLIQALSNILAHVNCRLPERVDKIIGTIFITPNLHHVHHHFEQPYTDCNYGDVLSIWDRIFGTFARMPKDKIVFGVDVYMDDAKKATFINLLGLPFGKYRRVGTK